MIAEQELSGVGSASLGQWTEIGEIAVHLRRRLTEEEAAAVGPVVDVRGTWEGTKRINRIRKYLSPSMQRLADEELV